MAMIEIDGKKIEANAGQMIIEVADEAGIPIPRFCYHKKLSVAANCRMCLVEIEKSPKTLPACATPVTDGMKVFTKSPKAIAAQKAVMEFLLINHPLDCPICDQGGECELQDLSMGYGEGISHFTEGKRVVDDEDLGSLIATDMTRCIHCTRCVRFGEEVAGVRELGMTERGENSRIGTYIKQSLTSEISGNIIDLCPVGALTSKPYRFTARAWELKQFDAIAPHDCLGSNIHLHVRGQQVMRVVPKENESINETWLSDRDRFSYLGLRENRLTKPMIKKSGIWEEVDWETALTTLVTRYKEVIQNHGTQQIAGLASPSSTLEELYLFQKLLRGFGCHNIDHRLHQTDFNDQDVAPLYPGMNFPYADLETEQAILLIGSHLQQEQPLAAVRVRKSSLAGGKVMSINLVDHDTCFDLSEKMLVSVSELPLFLAEILALLKDKEGFPKELLPLVSNKVPSEQAKRMQRILSENERSTIILGAMVHNHPEAALIRSLVKTIGELTQTKLVEMTTGANSAGAYLAGVLPHRKEAGAALNLPGLPVQTALQDQLKAYLLLSIEPDLDFADSVLAMNAFKEASFVCVLTSYTSEAMMSVADILLPIATFAETSGTYVNVEGKWQSFKGALMPMGDARPAWKILRVLGNLFGLEEFDYKDSESVRDELRDRVDKASFKVSSNYYPRELGEPDSNLRRITEWPLYATDSLVRRSNALQKSAANQALGAYINSKMAKQYNLQSGEVVLTMHEGKELTLPLFIDERISDQSVYVASGIEKTKELGESFGFVTLKQQFS